MESLGLDVLLTPQQAYLFVRIIVLNLRDRMHGFQIITMEFVTWWTVRLYTSAWAAFLAVRIINMLEWPI